MWDDLGWIVQKLSIECAIKLIDMFTVHVDNLLWRMQDLTYLPYIYILSSLISIVKNKVPESSLNVTEIDIRAPHDTARLSFLLFTLGN
jgi:hypothetical protein